MKRKVAALFATEDGEFPRSMSVFENGRSECERRRAADVCKADLRISALLRQAECVRMKSTADLWLHRRDAF